MINEQFKVNSVTSRKSCSNKKKTRRVAKPEIINTIKHITNIKKTKGKLKGDDALCF